MTVRSGLPLDIKSHFFFQKDALLSSGPLIRHSTIFQFHERARQSHHMFLSADFGPGRREPFLGQKSSVPQWRGVEAETQDKSHFHFLH